MMLTKKQYREAQRRALEYMLKARVVLSEEEKQNIGVADFGLSDLEHQGGQILTFFNTDRISAKVIVLFPWQILPEHWHPQIGNDIGKKEVMRVRSGEVYLYMPGDPTPNPRTKIVPEEKKTFYRVARNYFASRRSIHYPPPELSTGFKQVRMELSLMTTQARRGTYRTASLTRRW
jgi:D-lyxose ketol-isomerase